MTDGQNRRMKGGAVESVGNILILVSVATGFVSFVALFKPFPQESFFTRKRVVVVWLASLALFALGGLLLPVPTLGPFFMLVSILAGTCSFIALFQPLPQIWLPTRKRAAVVWAASFALVALGGSLMSDLEKAETRLAAEADQAEARLAEDARRAASEESARVAAERFPTRREEFEQRLSDLKALTDDAAWNEALRDGGALQRELLPLFRSSVAQTPEVASIRSRLNGLLAFAENQTVTGRFSVIERQRIFRALIMCERDATATADARYPETVDPNHPAYDRATIGERLEAAVDYQTTLMNECKAALRMEHDLSEDDVQDISLEGGKSRWPPLSQIGR